MNPNRKVVAVKPKSDNYHRRKPTPTTVKILKLNLNFKCNITSGQLLFYILLFFLIYVVLLTLV